MSDCNYNNCGYTYNCNNYGYQTQQPTQALTQTSFTNSICKTMIRLNIHNQKKDKTVYSIQVNGSGLSIIGVGQTSNQGNSGISSSVAGIITGTPNCFTATIYIQNVSNEKENYYGTIQFNVCGNQVTGSLVNSQIYSNGKNGKMTMPVLAQLDILGQVTCSGATRFISFDQNFSITISES